MVRRLGIPTVLITASRKQVLRFRCILIDLVSNIQTIRMVCILHWKNRCLEKQFDAEETMLSISKKVLDRSSEEEKPLRPSRRVGVNPERQTQEERSEGTQQRILNAAIELLYNEGYVAATTHKIAERAGVSRGAMLHHFPSKDDLMLAVVRAAHERDSISLRAGLAKISDPLERYFALPDLAWK